CSPSQPRTSSSRSAPKPDVPTTASRPCSTHQRRLPMTAAGWVKSTTTSQSSSASSLSPWSTSAATSMSGASGRVRITSRPTRPRAPSTPTLVIAVLPVAALIVCRYPGQTEVLTHDIAGGSDLEGGGVVEGADDGQGLRAGEDLGGDGAHVVVGDGVDRREHL